MLHIYNTLTREKEKFKPLKQENVKVYSCGPTVYNHAHIGNLRANTFYDTTVRCLRFLGYKVTSTMNITDIDDKTIRDSQKSGEELLSFTQKYTKYFLEDLEKLNIIPADNITPISELIPEMVRMIQTMLNRKNAYIADDGSVYFSVKSYKKYGRLANLDMKGMKAGARVDNDEYEKDNVSDFVLWKAWKQEDGENFWEEEFTFEGETKILKGRPGWHIECSACSMKHFGPQIDIHMGGVDLIFPHHQNEIAQTEACTRKTFSKYWLHSGHLMVDGKKMSKSLNNFYKLTDIEEKFSNISQKLVHRGVRLSFLGGKYQDSIDFSFDKLEQKINTIKKIDETCKLLRDYVGEDIGISREFREDMQGLMNDFIDLIEDNFNMPEALSLFFSFQKFINSGLAQKQFSASEKESILDMLKSFDEVFGIFDFGIFEELSQEVPQEIQKKIDERFQAKREKNWGLADSIRDELLEKGWKIVDTKEGSKGERL